AVRDAMQARNRFSEALGTFRAGPLRDNLAGVATRLDEAVEESWQIAKQGQVVADARKQVNDREIRWELDQVQGSLRGAEPNETQVRTVAALEAQLATAARMDA